MNIFPPKLRNKVIQMTYRPKSKKEKSGSPFANLEKMLNDGIEGMFMASEDSDEKSENDDEEK